jgi:hypothetical protein
MKFRNSINAEKRSAVKEAAANLLATMVHKGKRRIVLVLQHWEQRCSQRQKKLLLFVFCGLFSGYCICLLVGAFGGNGITELRLRQNGTPPLALPPPMPKTDSIKPVNNRPMKF